MLEFNISGSAADLCKVAMIQVTHALYEQQLQAKMLAQIHDELLLEVPDDQVQQVAGNTDYKVPLKVNSRCYAQKWQSVLYTMGEKHVLALEVTPLTI